LITQCGEPRAQFISAETAKMKNAIDLAGVRVE
jgi:hypothetical protein